jgi:hypothetical protein
MKHVAYLLSILLTGCGSVSPDERAVTNSVDYAAKVQSLPESQRRAVLFRAIRNAGLDCQGVDAAERVRAAGSQPQWRLRCTNGDQHLVSVDRSGTALVVSRRGM